MSKKIQLANFKCEKAPISFFHYSVLAYKVSISKC